METKKNQLMETLRSVRRLENLRKTAVKHSVYTRAREACSRRRKLGPRPEPVATLGGLVQNPKSWCSPRTIRRCILDRRVGEKIFRRKFSSVALNQVFERSLTWFFERSLTWFFERSAATIYERSLGVFPAAFYVVQN